MSNDNSAMLTPDEVAARLQVSKATVLRLSKVGKLRPLRIGARTLRFDPSEVARFVEGQGHATA